MDVNKAEFIKFIWEMVRTGAFLVDRKYLETGVPDLFLKDGRRALYFFNAGNFNKGSSSSILGKAYAARLAQHTDTFDIIYGPAYKGITIANSAAEELWNDFHIDRGWAYRRKEAKTAGEKGAFVGTQFFNGCRVQLVDDVITSAKTKIDEKEEIHEYGKLKGIKVNFSGLLIALDREQKAVIGEGADKKQLDVSAAEYFTDKTGIPVDRILTITETVNQMYDEKLTDANGIVVVDDRFMKAFEEYKKEFGV